MATPCPHVAGVVLNARPGGEDEYGWMLYRCGACDLVSAGFIPVNLGLRRGVPLVAAVELVRASSREDFEALEGEVASCDAVHVGDYADSAAVHAAIEELLAAGLSPDVNHHRDPETGDETFSLWYYPWWRSGRG